MKKELILGFDAEVVNELFHEGMNKPPRTDVYERLYENMVIQPRYIAETSTKTRHIIPYIVLYSEKTREVFLYRRTSKVGESRLAGNASCGIGGHVDINEYALDVCKNSHEPLTDILVDTANRELVEEMGSRYNDTLTMLGFLRDDSDEVGKVHLGWICVKFVDREDISVQEDELETIGWRKLDEIDAEDEELNLENWSKQLIAYLQTDGKDYLHSFY